MCTEKKATAHSAATTNHGPANQQVISHPCLPARSVGASSVRLLDKNDRAPGRWRSCREKCGYACFCMHPALILSCRLLLLLRLHLTDVLLCSIFENEIVGLRHSDGRILTLTSFRVSKIIRTTRRQEIHSKIHRTLFNTFLHNGYFRTHIQPFSQKYFQQIIVLPISSSSDSIQHSNTH